MPRRLVPLALLLAALAAVPASAKTVHFLNFRSPSGALSCVTEAHGLRGVECFSPAVRGKYTDGYLRIRGHGRVTRGERGDYPGYPNARAHTLRYGVRWTRRGVRCVVRRSGLTCRNRSGHGFHLTRDSARRF